MGQSCATPIPLLGHRIDRPHADHVVVRQPVAVGDQQRRSHIGAVGERLQVAVHHHRSLRVTRQHHLGGRAALRERCVLRAQRGRPGIDAAHEAGPAHQVTVGGHRHRGVLDRLSGDGAAILLQQPRKVAVGLERHSAHPGVRGRIHPLTRACGSDPVDVGATGIRMRGTGRQTNECGTSHSGGARQRTNTSQHRTPYPSRDHKPVAMFIASPVARVTPLTAGCPPRSTKWRDLLAPFRPFVRFGESRHKRKRRPPEGERRFAVLLDHLMIT